MHVTNLTNILQDLVNTTFAIIVQNHYFLACRVKNDIVWITNAVQFYVSALSFSTSDLF